MHWILDEKLRRQMEDNLSHFECNSASIKGFRPAAVALVIVADEQSQPCFILTRRAGKLPSHAGQFALPGGSMEAGETPQQTALRELSEEVGIVMYEEGVLGLLDDYVTRSGFVVTPVVLWHGEQVRLKPNRAEVADVFIVPLAVLGDSRVPQLHTIPESDNPVISVPIPMLQASIHAPTAAIIYQLWEVAVMGRSTRVAHYEQPVFAWR